VSRRLSEAERRWDRARKRLQAERWRAAGACIDCGQPVSKFVRCQVHRAQRAAYNLAYWHRRKGAAA
jgi:hypothetical protein